MAVVTEQKNTGQAAGSPWHFRQTNSFAETRVMVAGGGSPCGSWQSVHVIAPSRSLWRNGRLKAAFTSAWQVAQSASTGLASRLAAGATSDTRSNRSTVSAASPARSMNCIRTRPATAASAWRTRPGRRDALRRANHSRAATAENDK